MNAGYSRPFAAGINPAGALLLDKDEIKTHQFNGNASFEARFLKHFKATANVGLQYYGQAENELTNPYYGDSAGKGQIVKTQVNYLNFTANQILSWTQSFGRNNFEAFVAHESTNSTTNVSYGAKSKMVRPDNTEWSNAVMMDYMESYTYGYAIESYLVSCVMTGIINTLFTEHFVLMVVHVLLKVISGEHLDLLELHGLLLTKNL